MSWHEKTSVVIVALAAAGAMVTAYATVRSMLMQRRKQTEQRPTLADPRIGISENPEIAHTVRFEVDKQHSSVWHVVEVRASPIWTPLISATGEQILNGYGDVVSYQPKELSRKIKFDPPTQSATLLLRYDCPSTVSLSFRLVMRASPSESSRFTTRIRIRD